MKLLCEVTEIFMRNSPTSLARIHQAIVEHDAWELREAAHALKGSVGNLSAEGAYRAAERLENMGSKRDFDLIDEAYEALAREVERLRSALKLLSEEGMA
jgi:HPt (histidine-containing phosphotransfer) domain-containing protein